MGNQDLSLKGKVALITGARRGIGRSIALAFAGAGADIAICDIELEDGELHSVAEKIQGLGQRVLALQADISRKTDIDRMIENVIERFGLIDILVNNAGVNARAPISDLKEEDWDRVIDTNLKGCFLCAQAVAKPMMNKNRGNIINLASQFAFKAIPNIGVYCIAKAGVVMLTHVLARELGQFGIRANAIAPGMVRTEYNRHIWSDEEFMKRFLPQIPLGRVADPDDIIGTALFLASDASKHMSGHTLIVDGGAIA